ncbi:hypothetical protein [Bdellovibrio sp. KM01]|uniref:hypothetical protein n=1 Tax=Bdellovibrio sp. KM01 TaxID=2748865 RepID=UPI0015E9B957|nr:hypothetical protein [Bdellovibrio sp. KM01]QLY25180.1 hypothetical protein HW988_17450 [Bdellovibrio sp. KM01]
MKKIVSLVVFVAALVWTWNVIHTNEAIGFETHAGIQTKLAELIKATLSAKKPNAKDLRIEKLWTESMNDNKVRAVFAYKFSETSEAGEALEQIIEGEAVLHREPTEDKTDKWTLQSVKTTNDIVVFSEGSTVTPDTVTPAEGTPAATPATTPAPEHH